MISQGYLLSVIMSEGNLSPVLDVIGTAPSEPASPAPTENLCNEDDHFPGDSPPEPPSRDVFAFDGTCTVGFSIFPIASQSYIEMHTTPDFPKHVACIPSDLA